VFDIVGWATGRHLACKKTEDQILKNKTRSKTTGSKQMYLADLTFEYFNATDVSHARQIRGAVPQHLQFFWTSYMRTRSMRNSNQLLHDDDFADFAKSAKFCRF